MVFLLNHLRGDSQPGRRYTKESMCRAYATGRDMPPAGLRGRQANRHEYRIMRRVNQRILYGALICPIFVLLYQFQFVTCYADIARE